MPVLTTCPACQRRVRVPSSAVGKTVKCPRCGTTFSALREDPTPAPARLPPDIDEAPTPPPIPASADDGRRVERQGAGLLAISQGLLAGSLTLQLLVALVHLAVPDIGMRGSAGKSAVELAALCWGLAEVMSAVVGVIGAAYCVMPPTALPVRAPAGAVLALAAVTVAVEATPFGSTNRGALASLALVPLAVGCGLQAMLAVYARRQARRLTDRIGVRIAGVLAIAYPAAVLGVVLLTATVGSVAGVPMPTFLQAMTILELLARAVLIAWGCFVLWRVWTRLGTA
jgi:predicted Zn finger-like uncharacterized protein